MNSKNLYKNLSINIFRYILAALFIFSGLAKGLNPFGLSIQFGEYFSAMGLSFLSPLSSLFAIVLPAFETLLGILLAIGLCRRLVSWIVMLMMLFFTALTLWIAIWNPVNDCGCFGDLLKISNWSTFIKNIILLPMSIGLVLWWEKDTSAHNKVIKWVLSIALSLFLPIYTSFTLPLIDATPFKVGVNIPQSMEIPAGATPPIQETTLIYRDLQSGKEQEFAITDTTWYDTTRWEFVDSRTRVISEGYVPPIAAFPMLDSTGNDLHNELLQTPTLLIVAVTDPEMIDRKAVERLAKAENARVVVLTSAPLTQVPSEMEAYNSDYSLIRTIIQHPKGGVMLIKNGTIVKKWAMPSIP